MPSSIRRAAFLCAILAMVAHAQFSTPTATPSASPKQTDYQLTPDSKVQPGVPQGKILHFTFDRSKIFPGTTREVTVYIPQQYDGRTPACVCVLQDGGGFNAPIVFDNLIAKKDIPVLIGVFIRPGVMKALTPGALDRFNRSVEYDGLGPDYANFVLNEILPAVENLAIPDGRHILLSKSGNDRCIGGISSGAICAFNAAWERPDAFTRVFSAIGTFTALRGGNEFPILIHKYEPKPIRVFQQDGSADLNIYGGDWWMANQEMERALTFAGYEHDHIWGDNGHSGKQGSEYFPDAMRFLWKGWPAPVKAGDGKNQFLHAILIPGEDWTSPPDGLASEPAVSFTNTTNQLPRQSLSKSGINARATVSRPDGSIYATEADPPKPGTVWFFSADGHQRLVDTGLKSPGGITLSPDQSLLYVGDTATQWVYSYQILPDGSLANKEHYFYLHTMPTNDDNGAYAMCCDTDGRLYIATSMGIQICDQAGRVNCILPVPGPNITSLAIGGKNLDTLRAASTTKVYTRRLKIKAALSWLPPIKPSAPHM